MSIPVVNRPMAKLNVTAEKITLFTAMEPLAQVSPSTSYVHMRNLNYLLFVYFLFERPVLRITEKEEPGDRLKEIVKIWDSISKLAKLQWNSNFIQL